MFFLLLRPTIARFQPMLYVSRLVLRPCIAAEHPRLF